MSTPADGKTDALLIEARRYEPGVWGLMMAVPYRNAADPAGFAVYRPKFPEVVGPAPDYSLLAEAFFRSIDRHERGAAVWNAHIDQSR
jgi:hypothetical protein